METSNRAACEHTSMIQHEVTHGEWTSAPNGSTTRVSLEESVCQICGTEIVQRFEERRLLLFSRVGPTASGAGE